MGDVGTSSEMKCALHLCRDAGIVANPYNGAWGGLKSPESRDFGNRVDYSADIG